MVKTNADVVGDKCITNDDGEPACTDSEKLSAWKQHYENLLNEEFPSEKEHLVHKEPCQGPHPKIGREWVKVAFQKMKDSKAVGTSGIAAEMLKAAGDIGLDILTDLCNTIIQENSIPSRWDVSIILNCFKGKGVALDYSNYRGLKLIEHALKVFERVIENFSEIRLTLAPCRLDLCQEKGLLMLSL